MTPVVHWRNDQSSRWKGRLLALGARSSSALHYGYVRASEILSMPATPSAPRAASAPVVPQAVADYVVRSLAERYPRVLLVSLPTQDLTAGSIPLRESQDEKLLRR